MTNLPPVEPVPLGQPAGLPPAPPAYPGSPGRDRGKPGAPGKLPGDGMAVTALILGLCSILMFCLTGVLSVVFGIIALAKGTQKKGSAITGIVLGAVMTFATPMLSILVTILMPTLGGARELGRQSMCGSNLNGVGKAIMMYQAENNNQFPTDLETAITKTGLPSGKILVCPSTGSVPPACDYVYVVPQADANSDTIIACDKTGNHRPGRNVLHLNGNVSWMTEADFQAELAAPHNAAFAAALAQAPATVRKGG